tara:strand:- start:2267 stop:2842 length:576 start_codon:yes stop_codon:yes gene_type:complete
MACNGCDKKWLNSRGNKPPTHKSKGFFSEDGELNHVEVVVVNTGRTACACDFPENGEGFYCDRHKCWKTEDLFQLCQKRQDYYNMWEEGKGPLQDMYVNSMKEGTKLEQEKETAEQEILERDYFMGDPDIPKKSRGLGDTVAKFNKATGIKAVVDTAFNAMDKDCGCKERQSKLNKLFPYGKRRKTKGFFE